VSVSDEISVGDHLTAIADAVARLDERGALALVGRALEDGEGPLDIIGACESGLRAVGERYERREYYLSGLIMAGEIFRGVVALTEHDLQHEFAGTASGRVLLGTVRGDIHDMGKNMTALALRAFGFTVLDLGVDVPAQRFVEAAQEFTPDVVGLSGLVSAAYTAMRDTVVALRASACEGLGAIPVVIGGGTIDQQVATVVGSDYWTTDAMEGVRICQRIVHERDAGRGRLGVEDAGDTERSA
jgi:methanogenic corrinoid protein MtbC1